LAGADLPSPVPAGPGGAGPVLAGPGLANVGLANPGLANVGLANVGLTNPGLANPGLGRRSVCRPGGLIGHGAGVGYCGGTVECVLCGFSWHVSTVSSD
jgi:hypothetical protein